MRRLAELQQALAVDEVFDALSKIRELIPDDGANEQEVVVYAFACILETSSAGMSILFDRFDDAELSKIDRSLEKIGATQALNDLRGLTTAFRGLVAKGMKRLDAAETLIEQPETQRMDRASDVQVEEMEQKLLEFCRQNVGALAAVRR
jgi:hypothetical protein